MAEKALKIDQYYYQQQAKKKGARSGVTIL